MKGQSVVILLLVILFFLSPLSMQATAVETLGWGWIGTGAGPSESSSEAIGFVSFNCENFREVAAYALPVCPSDYNVSVDTDAGTVNGWAWIGVTDDSTHDATGWLRFSDNTSDYLYQHFYSSMPAACVSKGITSEALPTYVDRGAVYVDGGIAGWARIMSLAWYGMEKYCSNDWGWVKLQGFIDADSDGIQDASEIDYGVSYSNEGCFYFSDIEYCNNLTSLGFEYDTYGRFGNWAWSGDGTDADDVAMTDTGLGEIKFDLTTSSSTSGTDPWLQILHGDIYSKLGFNMRRLAPSGSDNATYLILTNGSIVNFSTTAGEPIYNYDLDFPTSTDDIVYSSNVGKINLTVLKSKSDTDYDSSIFNESLKGKVYVADSDVIISNNEIIYNGDGSGDCDVIGEDCLGNGTIIVEGDLTVNNNISYEDGTVSNLNNIASIAWIITGDLIINGSVNQLDGNYIVLGNSTGGGSIDTGTGSVQLTVHGLMMARNFVFGRDVTMDMAGGEEIPAEKIIYDGRAFANTPPGLEDIVATLPELSIATP